MSDGVRIKNRYGGDLWSSFLLCHFEHGQFWFVVRQGMLGAYCWLLWLVPVGVGGCTAFPWFPQTGLKSLLGWYIPKPCGPNLGTWSTGGKWCPSYLRCLPRYLWTLGHFPGPWPVVPVLWPADMLWGHAVLSQTSLAIIWVGETRGVSVHPSSLMASVSGAIWSAARDVVLSCSGQGSHQSGYLVS